MKRIFGKMQKEEILIELKSRIHQKIFDIQTLIVETRESNNETKSSMGDKYETGREMLAQQINHLQNQLKVQLDFQNSLSKLTLEPSDRVKNGALVQTDKGWFYISIGFGELNFHSTKIFAVSADAPLVKAMWNLKVGEEFNLNSISQKILAIY